MDQNLELHENRDRQSHQMAFEEQREELQNAPLEPVVEQREENQGENDAAADQERLSQSGFRRLLDTIDRRHRRHKEALMNPAEEERRYRPKRRPLRREENALRALKEEKRNQYLRVSDMRLVEGVQKEQTAAETGFTAALNGLGQELEGDEWLNAQELTAWMKEGNDRENLALLRKMTGEDDEDRRQELSYLTDEVLSYDFSEHMVKEEWLGENAARFYRMTERAISLWNLYNTEKNKKLYEELPKGVRDLIDEKAQQAAALKEYVKLSLSRRGVAYGVGADYEEDFSEEKREQSLQEATDARLETVLDNLRIHLSEERKISGRLLSLARNDEFMDSQERSRVNTVSYHDFAAMIGTKNRGQVTFTEKGIGIINNHYGDNLSRQRTRTDRILRERLLAVSLERLADRATPEVVLGLKKTLGIEREGQTATPLTRLELRDVLARVNRLSSRVEETLAKRKGSKNADHRFALVASELFVWNMDADDMEHPTKQQKKAMKEAIKKIYEDAQKADSSLQLRKLSEHQLDNMVNGNIALLKDNIFEAFRSVYAVMESVNGGKKQNHDLLAGNDGLVKKTAALVIERMACRTEKEEIFAADALKQHLVSTAFSLAGKQPLQTDFQNLFVGDLSGGTEGLYALMEQREPEQTREQKKETDRFVQLCEEMSELNKLEAKALNSGITGEEAARLRDLGVSVDWALLHPDAYERTARVLRGTRFSTGFMRALERRRSGISFSETARRISEQTTLLSAEEQNKIPVREDPEQGEATDTEKLLSKLNKAQQTVGKLLLLSVIPSDLVKENLDETARGIVALKDTLKRFSKTDEVAVSDVVFPGVSVRLFKRTDQSLYANIDGHLLPLSCNAATLARRLEEDICIHYRKFGPDAVKSVVEELKEEAETPAERVKIRDITVKLLSGLTGEAGAFFDNLSLKQLVQDAKALTLQGKDPAVYVSEVRMVENRNLINNEETKDLLKASLELPKEEREKKVLIKKKDGPVREEDDWYEDDPNEFTEDQKKVQAMLSDLIFSEETWETEKYANQPGKRLQNTFAKHQDTLFLMFENPDLLEKVLSILPEPEKQENQEKEKKPSARESVAGIFKDFFVAMAPAKVLPFEYLRRKSFNSLLSTALDNMEKEGKFQELERTLDENVTAALEELQSSINSVVHEIFQQEEGEIPENEKAENLPDPNAWFISKGERARRRKNRAKASAKELDFEMKKIANGQEGQGKFTRLVLERYFTSMDLMDKRAMVSAAFRYGKPNPPLPKNAKEKDREKAEKKKQCDWLGGLLKGAGPLIQKMLQGVPLSTLPKELQPAVEEMKSALAPIPEAVVQAQMMGIVDRSEGKITKIVVEKPLGAASVGQAFLCKLYGPGNEEGKSVVVKLLRPDVRNRMMREMDVMKQCAQDTDESGGMLATYEGQLKRIEEELDLTIEARNAFRGMVYDGKYRELSTAKLCSEAKPTANTLVMEAAPGTTVDRYLKEVREEREKLLAPLRGQGGLQAHFSSYGAAETREARERLVELSLTLEKRQKHLCKLAKAWVTEGVYGEGFYHGDLHAGNIMITDDTATVIDYGNATKLTTEQQEEVTRMMAAAAVGDMEVFRSGYHNLLKGNPAMEEKYQRCRDQLGEIIKDVFKKGDSTVTGQRIAVVLLKSQELGLEIPSAIYNFSQSQLRMQNTLQDINDLLDQVKRDIRSLDVMVDPEAVADPIMMAMRSRHILNVSKETAYYKLQGRIGLDSGDFLSALQAKDSRSREQFDWLYMDFAKLDEAKLKQQLKQLGWQVITEIANDGPGDSVYMTLNDNSAYYATGGVISMVMPDFIKRIQDIASKDRPNADKTSLLYAEQLEAWKNKVLEEEERLLDEFLFQAQVYLAPAESLREQLAAIRKAQDEDRRGELAQMEANFTEEYWKLQKKTLRGEPFLQRMLRNLKDKSGPYYVDGQRLKDSKGRNVLTKREAFDVEMKPWFADEKNHGKELEAAYREYRKIKARDQKDPKVQEDLKKAEDRFFDIFVEAVRGKMKVIIDQLTWHDKLEPDSFFDVMGEVIDENLKSSLSRVGFFKSLSYRFKLN